MTGSGSEAVRRWRQRGPGNAIHPIGCGPRTNDANARERSENMMAGNRCSRDRPISTIRFFIVRLSWVVNHAAERMAEQGHCLLE